MASASGSRHVKISKQEHMLEELLGKNLEDAKRLLKLSGVVAWQNLWL
jgi:hypothetical protein